MNTASGLWLLAAAELLLFSLFWLATSRLQSAQQRAGTQVLAACNGLMALGLALVAWRSSHPGLLTTVGANVLVLAATALLWHGGAMNLRVDTRKEPFVVLAVGTVLMVGLYLVGARDNLRIAVLFLASAWMFLRAASLAYPLLAARDNHGRRTARLLLAVATVVSAALVWRTTEGLLQSESIDVSRNSTGSYAVVFFTLCGLSLANGLLAYAVVRALVRDLQRMASLDPLTGLSNRRAFWLAADRLWSSWKRQGTGFALACVDVDHFKQVNDQFGHGAGDEVLQRIARVMQMQARPIDEAARFGGEEFVLLIADTTTEAQALMVAERLRDWVAATDMASVLGQRRITVSIGVALVDARDASPQALLDRADEALYQAKREGRNRCCVAGLRQPDFQA